MTARGWPHAELETMVELWNAGTLSLVEIAVKMGKTKAMINGMAHRITQYVNKIPNRPQHGRTATKRRVTNWMPVHHYSHWTCLEN